MPLYEFECDACGKRFEEIRNVDERDVPMPHHLPEEGSCRGRLIRQISTPQSYIGSTDRPTRGQG